MEDLNEHDILVICAAGNDNGSVAYPAGYSIDLDNIIAVSSVTKSGTKSPFSNYGQAINVCAPGGDGDPVSDSEDILSTVPFYYHANDYDYPAEWPAGFGYSPYAGTSMATPHVTGTVALMLSIKPSLTPKQIRNILMVTTKDLGTPGRDDYFGAGVIQADDALNAILDIPNTPTGFNISGVVGGHPTIVMLKLEPYFYNI